MTEGTAHGNQGRSVNRRWFAVALGAVVLVVAAFTGVMALRGPQVDALLVQSAPLVRTLQFSARVATLSRVDVGSTVTGRVAQVQVTEGAQVRQGDVLVQLESDELAAALAQAVAAERQAQSRLVGLRSSGRRAAQAARAPVQANADAGTDVVQAQAQLALARAATVAAQARLAQTTLVAPADARVLVRDVEPGQIVQPGKALLSLALAGPTQLVAQVDERFLDQLLPGQKASVVADAFAGQRFAARVLTIAPSVDAQRGAIEVKCALEQHAPAFLREDMPLSVEVETARRERTLLLPQAALRGPVEGDQATVLVLQEGRAQARPVRLGLRTLDAVEVLDGLAEGDTVLRGGAVQAGDRVRARTVEWSAGSAAAGAAQGRAQVADAGAALTNAMGR